MYYHHFLIGACSRCVWTDTTTDTTTGVDAGFNAEPRAAGGFTAAVTEDGLVLALQIGKLQEHALHKERQGGSCDERAVARVS